METTPRNKRLQSGHREVKGKKGEKSKTRSRSRPRSHTSTLTLPCSIRSFATRIGLDFSFLSRILRRQRRPSIRSAALISAGLGISIDEMLARLDGRWVEPEPGPESVSDDLEGDQVTQ